MSKEPVLQHWPDGHELRKDKWQWILQHPHTCKNARRDGLKYAKATYFVSQDFLRQEAHACHVKLNLP